MRSTAHRVFPGLDRTDASGRPVVFADAPGGTQVPDVVIAAMSDYMRRGTANVGGAFETSKATDKVVRGAREAAADLLGVEPREIVFGANATTLLFALSRTLTRLLTPADDVLVTNLDHEANITPWVIAAREAGASVRRLDVDPEDCTLDPAGLAALVGPRTRIVAFTLASNAVGTITAAADLIGVARDAGAITIVDAVHLAPHVPIDVEELRPDVLVCSPYKFFGPHLGVMYGRHELLAEWTPYKLAAQSDDVPLRWETGTLSHEALAGLTACIDYIASLSPRSVTSRQEAVALAIEEIKAHEAVLTRMFLTGATAIPGVRMFGIADSTRAAERTPTFAFRVRGQTARMSAELLAQRGVFVWDGDFFAPTLIERLGSAAAGGLIRVGFCHYHTTDDVERVLEELTAVATSGRLAAGAE